MALGTEKFQLQFFGCKWDTVRSHLHRVRVYRMAICQIAISAGSVLTTAAAWTGGPVSNRLVRRVLGKLTNEPIYLSC